jgi:hypothetical protein
MAYLWAILAGAAGAVVGWFVTGAVAAWIAALFGMSDFEGGRGMFAFLFVGPIGGLVTMLLAIWAALRVARGREPLVPTLARVGLVLALIAGLVGAGIGLRLATIDTYTDEAPPTLEFEIRVPAAMTPAERSAVRVELHTDRNVGDGYLADPWIRPEGEDQVIAGGVPLAFKTSARLLAVSLPGQPTRLFRLRLARDPRSTPALGDWQPPDFVDTAGPSQPTAAPADDPVALRVRVRRPGDP